MRERRCGFSGPKQNEIKRSVLENFSYTHGFEEMPKIGCAYLKGDYFKLRCSFEYWPVNTAYEHAIFPLVPSRIL